ncbi:MAG TPA: DEAD/DEAH box helicase [Candidatus Binatia bacterium]|nr:DEAD/DEAH box helicase [Candidatus Binatia bacterium]
MRRIRDLRKYGLPDTLLDIWAQRQGEFLLPVQEVAVQRYDLFEGRSLVISSPTSSGKTFVGEMAAMRATFAGKRVLYLTPLRALAEEKYHTFRARYEAYGVKVVVATRDRREFDRDIEQGDFHLAVLVYEKLSQLLVRHPHLLRTVALVVVDELQMLGDPERGPGLELSLAKLLASDPRPQLLGLSAVLREAQQVADWLEADLLFQEDRPVELYRGVLLGDRFRYKAYNSGEEGEERLAAVESEDPRELLCANVKHLVGKGEQVLVFLKGKRDTVQCAAALAEVLALPPARDALAALEPLEETALKAQLRTAFAGGVAFHHADLTPEERALVETYYRRGELRVIACTTTLAFGVNLPATTVFVEAVKWDADKRTGAAIEVPISWAEYENISGRAGRLGFHEEFGRSVLIAANQFQADLLWRSFVMGEQEQFTPAPGQAGLADRVLNLIASQVCVSKAELRTFFGLTYLGFQQRGKDAALAAEVEKALDALISTQLVTLGEDGRLGATTLGEVAARKGIRAATAVRLARFFEAARGRPIPELELFHLLSLTEEGKKVHLPLSAAEHRGRVYESQVSEHVRESGEEPGEGLGRLLNARMLPTAQEARSAKLALLLLGWTKGENLAGLESRYQCYAGTIMALTDEVSWLVDAAAEVAEVMGWTPTTRLGELAECVRFGIGPAGLPLARAQLPGLGREDIKNLVAAGLDSPAALREAAPEVLARYLSPGQIQALRGAALPDS